MKIEVKILYLFYSYLKDVIFKNLELIMTNLFLRVTKLDFCLARHD